MRQPLDRPAGPTRTVCRRVWGLTLGMLAVSGISCAEFGPRPSVAALTPRTTAGTAVAHHVEQKPTIQLASYQEKAAAPTEVETIPAPEPVKPLNKEVPISLDTVFRLAEEQNGQIGLARERVNEAFAEQALADKGWLPIVNVGAGYYRHEGGIQDFRGPLISSSTGATIGGLTFNGKIDVREALVRQINAERQIWQQRGELSRVNTEQLLDASTLYIDLLAARTGLALLHDREKDLKDALDRTRRLLKTEPGARLDLIRLESQNTGRERAALQLQQQIASASARLAYLLGIDPSVTFVPVEERLVPIDLVDVSPPAEVLAARALSEGPGVRELEGLIGTIECGLAKAEEPLTKYMPILELRFIEGGYGAGKNANLAWDNRFDMLASARWNLTESYTNQDRKHIAEIKLNQAHLAYEDLRRKLTFGVHEARGVITLNKDQIRTAERQIDDLKKVLDMTTKRLESMVQNTSTTDLVFSATLLAEAQLNYLSAVRDYDKAELRLLLLLGAACGPRPTVAPVPALPEKAATTPTSRRKP